MAEPQTGKGTGEPFVVDRPAGHGHPADTYRLCHADTIPHIAPGEHDAQRRASNRAWHALMLARTPEAWGELLRGHELPDDQLDHNYHQRAVRRTRRP